MKTQNYSRKRQAVYELLVSADSHPSAEWIYRSLKPEYPDLSLGTVYRNLKLLEENGAVRSVAVVGGCERYDGRVEPHSHFICMKCGLVKDISLSVDVSQLLGEKHIDGVGDVENCSLIFYGSCDECRAAAQS